jgi:hypothetical protein
MFFTALLILIILILVGNYVYHYYNTPTEVKVNFPPANYMAQIGAQCPNMWDVASINQQQVVCRNTANLPVNKTDAKCGAQGDTITFPTVTEWPVSKKNTKAQLNTGSGNTYSRCQFVQQCGSGAPVAWDGMGIACV